MFKHGCMALVAIACAAVVPAAHAEGNFFVAGQVGQAKYHDIDFGDDTAGTYAISGGYRWQAGAVTQVGVEAGYGRVNEVHEAHSWGNGYTDSGHARVGMKARYAHIGANARFSFGEGSRWFAILRAGYIGYKQDVSFESTSYFEGSIIDSYSGSHSDDGGGAYFGAGIGFDVTPNFSVSVMRSGYAFSSSDSGDWNDDYGTAATNTLGLELRF
ncbi:outer membrane beta-barrel protein [Marilutibacter alkalisoli]|nr:outer membrane beta-barrel protein [Lysobacter alkalisoli]